MHIILRTSSIPLMVSYLKDLKEGTSGSNRIDSLLDHPDYAFELDRYRVPSRETLISYFENLGSISESDIPDLSPERPAALRNKHPLWKAAYGDPDRYTDLAEAMKALLTEEKLSWIASRVQKGLPEMPVPDVEIVSTMSIGPSFGYVHNDALHIDIMGIGVHCDLPALSAVIAHEVHHVALWGFVSPFLERLTLEERFLFGFSGEGLAVKFCNNARGALSESPYPGEAVNEGLDDCSMDYLNSHFDAIFGVFVDTVKGIREGRLSDKEIEEHLEQYWWNLYPDDQNRDEPPKLRQARIYSLGNDLYGTIYDAFGTDVLFDCVRNPLKTIDCFRQAAAKSKRPDIAQAMEGL